MDDGETSILGAFVLFCLICAGIFAAWVVLGPGDQWVTSVYERMSWHLQDLADWYERKVNGPSKLIAPAITIASGSYAIVKAYKYAEARLHHRLVDYLDREERRLADARKQLRLIIERPNVDRWFREPIFLVPPLKRAVRELGWGSYFMGPQLRYVGFQLDASVDQLTHQIAASKARHRHLEKQLATAHLLKGAMYVAEASAANANRSEARVGMTNALNHFESALAVDSHDCEALEYASHVHVYFDDDPQARNRLNQILKLTEGTGKSLSRARALRYQADLDVSRGNNGKAKRHLEHAQQVLPNMYGDDRIEEAELHENLADRLMDLKAHKRARSQWEIALALFSELKSTSALDGARRVKAKLAQLAQIPVKDLDEDGADEDDDA